jgi:hypothetical protein
MKENFLGSTYSNLVRYNARPMFIWTLVRAPVSRTCAA